jgi:hypothetical protein
MAPEVGNPAAAAGEGRFEAVLGSFIGLETATECQLVAVAECFYGLLIRRFQKKRDSPVGRASRLT